ncbi:hypothetical protein ABGB19_04675 [Mycobacterium sp. B14F4]|uniref:hypothetical protein n=1 Tax=Mycobacterium sp. B14F4 TaxID=3153565 RepID=UPI00325DDEA1
MRLTAAFFANHAEVVGGMLNLQGGFWASTTVAADANGFRTNAVVLCEVDTEDFDRAFTLAIDAEGPTGQRLLVTISKFTIEVPSLFMCLPNLVLPIQRGGGFHTYSFRIDGQHERIDVRLAVRQALG